MSDTQQTPRWLFELQRYEAGKTTHFNAVRRGETSPIEQAVRFCTQHYLAWQREAVEATGGQSSRMIRDMFASLRAEIETLARTRLAGIVVEIEEPGLAAMVDRMVVAIQSRGKEMTL